MTLATAEHAAVSGRGPGGAVHSDAGATGAELALTTPAADYLRRVTQVLVRYSANFTGTVTMAVVSALGAEYETQAPSISFAAAQSGRHIFEGEGLALAPGDRLRVTAPPLLGQTAHIAVYEEHR